MIAVSLEMSDEPKNFTDPYNIRFLYRYNDKETDNYYNVIPADYNKSVALAILVKHVWMDAYTELLGQEFLKTYSPRIQALVRQPAPSDRDHDDGRG